MVMEGVSRQSGLGFEFQHPLLDGPIFQIYCCKNCNGCLKRSKIKDKRGRGGPFLINSDGMGFLPKIIIFGRSETTVNVLHIC